MGTYKIIISFSLMGLLLASCGKKDTQDMNLDELRQECDLLRQDRAKALENNVEAQELIDNIFASINSISGRTAVLERSLEGGQGADNRRKADEIAQDISIVKEKLARAEELEKFDKSTKIVISKLKATIEQKQSEINELKEIIRAKDEQISRLDHQVSSLDNELGQTNQELRESNAALSQTREKLRETEINSWISMGDELINAAETLPKVKGHGNMKPVKSAKLLFILKAKNCYQRAEQLGSYVASSRVSYAQKLYSQINSNQY